MKAVGIIAEYNPFHNGHKYHLEQAKALTGADCVVVAMSGSMTQRGDRALCDKWSRARMAMDSGADLVLELPFAFCVNSAEEFARGGVSLLKGLGCISDLVFGCESNPDDLIPMARNSAQEEEKFSNYIREGLKAGLSYPKARGNAFGAFHLNGQSLSLDRPNDILAVEYVRQLELQRSEIRPHGVLRRGDYHDTRVQEREFVFSSATAVRQAIEQGEWDEVKRAVPEATNRILEQCGREGQFQSCEDHQRHAMDIMVLSHLLSLGPEGLRSIYGCSEGMEYRIWNALPKVTTVEELLKEISSGRYTTARLRRFLIHSLLGMTKELYQQIRMAAECGGLYARVLACNEMGSFLLKQVKKREGTIPVYTNLNKELSEEEKQLVKGICKINPQEEGCGRTASLMLDVRSSDFFTLGQGKRLYDGSDFVKGPYIAHKKEKNHK